MFSTPHNGLQLPPPLPGRVPPTFNGNGQYRLPDPQTGALTSYARASTVAKTLEDTYMLDKWSQRMVLLGAATNTTVFPDLRKIIEDHLDDGGNQRTMAADLRKPLNRLAEKSKIVAGATYAAEFGTAVHAWCEWVDVGAGHVVNVPEMFRPWVIAHLRVLATSGLSVAPDWTERIVLNTTYGIAGTLDRLFWDPRGTLYMGDLKTSSSMTHSWLYFAIQLAIYHGASHVLSLDGKSWDPMPELDPDTVLISHLPSGDHTEAAIVPLNARFGAAALRLAVKVREYRTRADKYAQTVSYAVEFPEDAQRYYTAKFLTQTSETEAELAGVWEEYQDIWTSDLTDLGHRTLRLLKEGEA